MSYDPTIGRFISEDPIAFDGRDSDLYRFVGNNPINDVDPSGLVGIPPTLIGMAATGPGFKKPDPPFPGRTKFKQKYPNAPTYEDALKDPDVSAAITTSYNEMVKAGKFMERGGWILWDPNGNGGKGDFVVSHDGVRNSEPRKTHFPISGPHRLDNGDPLDGYVLIGFYHVHPTGGFSMPSPADYDDSDKFNGLPGLLITPSGGLRPYQGSRDPK
jgi:uncharacterized protein RhaS with RHS repeats